MEIKSYGYSTDICKKVSVSQWLVPEILTDSFDGVDHAIDRTKEKLSENKDVKNIITEVHMPLDEYRWLITEAVKKGQCDAWDLARRIVTTGDDCYTIDEVNKAFGNMNFLRTPVEEILAKDKEYQEEKKELHVGDEVEFDTKLGVASVTAGEKYRGYINRGYITHLVSPNLVRVLTKEIGTIPADPKNCKKTGRHSDEIERAMA